MLGKNSSTPVYCTQNSDSSSFYSIYSKPISDLLLTFDFLLACLYVNCFLNCLFGLEQSVFIDRALSIRGVILHARHDSVFKKRLPKTWLQVLFRYTLALVLGFVALIKKKLEGSSKIVAASREDYIS